MFFSDIINHIRTTAPPLLPLSVLLLEDSDNDAHIIRRAIGEAWKKGTTHVTEVGRLSQAFSCLRRENFDCIVADINLPDMSGPIVISALHAEVPHIPIVAYSGMADEKFQEKILNCGALHYVVKGYESPEALREIFVKTLGSHPHA